MRAAVPYTQTLDAQSVIPYLASPSQGPVRRNSFTELGTGLKPSSVKLWPCVIRVGPISISTDVLFTSEALCHDNGGTWYGPPASQPNPPYATSCAVRAAGIYPSLTILPPQVWALRNDRYKVVQFERPSCDSALGEYEFYDLSVRSTTNPIGLDLARANLTNGQPAGLTSG